MTSEHREPVQLPYLETFSKAAELSSFTAAADALGLTQAAVSQRIQTLERTLDVSLFQRQGGRILLTEAGQRLYAYAQKILALHQEAFQEVTGQRAPIRGELLLAASTVPGEHLLPAILAVFHKQYPDIQVKASSADSLAVVSQVEQGHVHLGLVGRKTENPHLEFRSFATDRMVLVVPPSHALSKRKQVSVEQFCEQPLILREPGSGSRWCLEQALARAGKSAGDLQIALELGSNEAIKEAVLRGLGVAVLSNYAVQKEIQTGQLRTVKVADLLLEREMFVAWDRRRALPAPARLLLTFLESRPAAELLP